MIAQVSMNVERPLELSLGEVVAAVARHAPVAGAELVGLAPLAALDGFPADLPMPASTLAPRHRERARRVASEPDPHR